MSGSSHSGWNIVNAIAVMLVLIVGAAMFFILTFQRPRRTSSPPSMTLIRGITQSMMTYAAGNKDYYPGLNSKGEVVDISVEYRFWELMDNNAFTGDFAISPYETKTVWTTGAVTSNNYSFSMLELEGAVGMKLASGRSEEWRLGINTQAVVMSDRNSGTDAHSGVQSIYPGSSPGSWFGAVGRNDGSVSYESTHLIDTRYGKAGSVNIDDNIFEAAGVDDAYMIYTGD